MADITAQAPSLPTTVHLVLYDGVCGLCSRGLQFLFAHDRRGVFAFATLQSATGRAVVESFGHDPDKLTSFYVLADYRTRNSRVFTKSRAVLFVASALGWPWRAATIARVLPRAVLDRAYDVVARNRYRVFGGAERCLLPSPELRRRFIDQAEGLV